MGPKSINRKDRQTEFNKDLQTTTQSTTAAYSKHRLSRCCHFLLSKPQLTLKKACLFICLIRLNTAFCDETLNCDTSGKRHIQHFNICLLCNNERLISKRIHLLLFPRVVWVCLFQFGFAAIFYLIQRFGKTGHTLKYKTLLHNPFWKIELGWQTQTQSYSHSTKSREDNLIW